MTEKTFNITKSISLIYEWRTADRSIWIIWPSLLFFPRGTVPGKESDTDLTLGWLCGGLTVRFKSNIPKKEFVSNPYDYLGGEPRGKLFRTSGILPGCDMRPEFKGIYGYIPLKEKDLMWEGYPICYYNERGEFTEFDPLRDKTIDGSYEKCNATSK